jgi:murein L,D-transpeptidase YcbB/YkuD
MTPSGGFKMIINSGESTTAMRTVNLSFNAGLDIKKIAISSKSDFSDSNQEDYSPTKTFDLCSKFAGSVKSPSCPDGEYTVYAKFYTQYGQSSDPVSAKINLKSNYRATQISSFTKSLKVGSRDSQVKNLQEFLNKNGFKIAKSGAGSVGKETNYFGKLTSVALAKFQEANKDKVPGIMKEKGFLGPKTREFINSLNK